MRTLDRDEDLTLTDLILIVQDLTCSEGEVVEVVSGLLEAGRVRLRSASLPAFRRRLASASTSIGA